MEIEPEHIPKEEIPPRRFVYRETRRTSRHGTLAMILFAAAALITGVVLLFFMFWLAIGLTAVGLLTLGVNALRGLLTGRKRPSSRNPEVRLHIGRRPPE